MTHRLGPSKSLEMVEEFGVFGWNPKKKSDSSNAEFSCHQEKDVLWG